MTRPDPADNLSWTAFRYALGELPEAETPAFESLLLDDQAAREALASAVELAGALAIVGAEALPALPARSPRRVLAWSSLAAAAAVLAAAWGLTLDRPEPEADRVASAWSVLADRSPIVVEDDDLSGPIEAGSDPDRPLPSWLLAGASEPSQDSPRVED